MQALQENGGAVEIAAGATFCICRTGGGRALLWGGLHAAGEAASQGTAVVEVMGIPSITHIAAGHSHAIFSDGERVWALGQYVSCFHVARCAWLEAAQDNQQRREISCIMTYLLWPADQVDVHAILHTRAASSSSHGDAG